MLVATMGLPERLQRRLAGGPLVRDGLQLAADTQLMLRIQELVHEPGAETLPLPEGRKAILRHAAMAGGHQPIGAVRDLDAGGLPARFYVPSEPAGQPGPLLVFLHGGGFVFGDLDSHDATCRLLAQRSGVRLLAIDYRLAPEHPFPAAYDDALAAFAWAHEKAASLGADPQRIGVGGDSAGGNLAAGVAIEAARTGLPCALQLLVYPATDAARATASSRLFDQGLYLTQRFLDLADESYRPREVDARDPRVSPAYAELPDGLAPAYVATAGFDPLRDEGEAYAHRLSEAGVDVELRRFDDQIHGFHNIVGAGRTSRAANLEIAAALRAGLVTQ